MSENPYQSSAATPTVPERRPFLTPLWLGAIIGSIILLLLGCVVVGLSLLPSDAAGFFRLFGAHLIACGALGAITAWTKGWGGVLFRWTSMIVNAALVFRLAHQQPSDKPQEWLIATGARPVMEHSFVSSIQRTRQRVLPATSTPRARAYFFLM